MDKTSMLYWFPKIKSLDIPMPETYIVELGKEAQEQMWIAFFKLLDGVKIEKEEENLCLNKYKNNFDKAVSKIGEPFFLRTDLTAHKHKWKNTCYVENRKDLWKHIWMLVEYHTIMEVGIVDLQAFIFRKYIPMDYLFKAFFGKLPISPERRYFIRDGKVEEHFPYWIPESIENALHKPDNWKENLKKINFESDKEIMELSFYAEKIARVLPEYWSVDFCRAKNKTWYLIDLAEGDKSWHPKNRNF